MFGRTSVSVALGASLLLIGCGDQTPHPTQGASDSPIPTEIASFSSPAATFGELDGGMIDQRDTTPALEFRSAGSRLIWSTGARASQNEDVAPDLLASTPGGSVEVLYNNPNRDSRLDYVGGDGSRVAFIETNDRVFGPGGWKLWIIPAPLQGAIELDKGVGGQLPFFAMSGDRIVWTAAMAQPEMSQLLMVDLTTMRRTILLASSPETMQYWFPSIDGTRIVFGTVEMAADGETDERHVYLLDLAQSSTPVRLDTSLSASEPVIRGDDVIWKESDPTLNFLVAGTLVHHSLATGRTEPLPLTTVSGLGFTSPSIGNRFVAAWAQSLRDIYLFDLEDRISVRVVDLGPMTEDPTDTVARPHIAGDLLAYVYGPKVGDLELRWVKLPR